MTLHKQGKKEEALAALRRSKTLETMAGKATDNVTAQASYREEERKKVWAATFAKLARALESEVRRCQGRLGVAEGKDPRRATGKKTASQREQEKRIRIELNKGNDIMAEVAVEIEQASEEVLRWQTTLTTLTSAMANPAQPPPAFSVETVHEEVEVRQERVVEGGERTVRRRAEKGREQYERKGGERTASCTAMWGA